MKTKPVILTLPFLEGLKITITFIYRDLSVCITPLELFFRGSSPWPSSFWVTYSTNSRTTSRAKPPPASSRALITSSPIPTGHNAVGVAASECCLETGRVSRQHDFHASNSRIIRSRCFAPAAWLARRNHERRDCACDCRRPSRHAARTG